MSGISVGSVNDRQQEVRCVLVASQYNGDCYIPLVVQYMYYTHFMSPFYGLFVNMKHVEIT